MKKKLTLICALILLLTTAMADVNLCLGNGTYKCYETDLTCADITIGPIIRACEDLSVAPGGGGYSTDGVITDLHPDLDGQGVAGPSSGFIGSAQTADDELVEFIVIFESRDTFAPGRRMQVVGAFDDVPLGLVATGDVTVTVFVIDPTTKSTVLSDHHTPINFGDLTWTFLADGPVGNETLSWGELKSSY